MEQKKGKAGEQLKDNKLSDYSSLLQSQSGPSQPRHWIGSSRPTDVSDHQPAPRKLSTIHAEKGALDGRRVTYSAEHLSNRLSLFRARSRKASKALSHEASALASYEAREAHEARKAIKLWLRKPRLKPTLKKEHSAIMSTTDSSDYLLDQAPPGTLTEAGMTKKHSSAVGGTPGVNQDDTRDMDLHALAGPSSFQLSISSHEEEVYDDVCNFDDEQFVSLPSATRACAGRFSTVCFEGSRTQDVYELLSEPGGDGGALPDMDVPVTAANCSVTNTLPAHSHLQIFSSDSRWSRRDSSCLPRSHSMPSLSQITSPNTCRGAGSLPNMLLNTSFEEFTPDITDDEHDETYRFQCSGPGLYQCSVTGLVFHMEGEGVLVYRTVPWSRRLLVQHHKRPAGPLFDIKCVPQSVCRLHLPHCEIRSTGGGDFLSVAHVTDEDVEFISPHEITETHVIINITGFSAFGNVKDEDSPADPVRALVLLFYKPPADPDPESLLNVLLLPRNVVLRDVLRFRKKLDGDERYIETSPHCKLHPKQEYSLSTRPEDDSVLVQPTEAEFDCDNYDNYYPSFQVRLKTILTDIKLFLRDTNSSHVVWEREKKEKMEQKKLSDSSSLLETPCELSEPEPLPILPRCTDSSGHHHHLMSGRRMIHYGARKQVKEDSSDVLKTGRLSYQLSEQGVNYVRPERLFNLLVPGDEVRSKRVLHQARSLGCLSTPTDVPDHQPAPRILFTRVEEKDPLDGQSVTYSAGEQLKDKDLSDLLEDPPVPESLDFLDLDDIDSLPETPSKQNQLEPLSGSSGFTDISVHQRRWPPRPSPRKLSTIDAEKGPLDDQSMNYSAEHFYNSWSIYIASLRASHEAHGAHKRSLGLCWQLKPTLKKEHSAIISTTDSSDYLLDQPPPGTLTEAGMRKKHSSAAGGTPGVNQDDTRDMELHAAAGPSSFQLSISSHEEEVYDFNDELSGCACSESSASSDQASTVCSDGSRTQDVYELSEQSEPGGDGDAPPDMDVPVTAVNCSVTNTLPAHSHLQIFSSDPRWSRRDSSCLPRSHSMPSLSQITSENTVTGAGSLPNMLLNTSFEEFTPDDDEHDETYRFQCSGPGLYQCSVTGLVFDMEGEGVLVYRTVPWSRRLLVQHHKRPAGPLFDIKCVQQSVCRLHLPHCEIRSTGGGDFLSVAHVTDEDVEFISPHEITETHVIINITGFSAFGNVKDEDSPTDPVRALVLLFYKPPADPVLTSLLNVLLLPKNVVLQDVVRIRKKLVGDERYIETPSQCKLHPKQEYSLSTRPEDDSVLVQPKEAEFDCDNYDNYIVSFQVEWETIMKHIKLLLRDTNSSHVVWERRVCLSSTGGRRSALNLPPPERLMDIRSSFVDSISGPVLKSLLDKLLEKKVIGDSEWGSADVIQNNSDKARFVIDTVRKKGEAASSEMIEFLCEADPFLCEHLGLT